MSLSHLIRCHVLLALVVLVPGCAAPAPPAAIASTAIVLERSTPAAGATVAAPVTTLMLRFARPVRLTELTVEGPGGLTPMMISAAGEVVDYSVPLPDLGPGAYTVQWKAGAGPSVVTGSFSFTVRG